MVIGDLATQCARRYPRKKATVSEGETQTFSQLNTRVNRLVDALNKLGLSQGDKVAVLSRNHPKMIELQFAAAKGAFVLVPLNFRLFGEELKFVINDAELDVLFVAEAFRETVEEVRQGISVPHLMNLEQDYEDMINSGSPGEPPAIAKPEDLFAIFYTSGTTAGPKGVMLTHENMLASAVNNVIAWQLGPADVCLHIQQLYHTMQSSLVLSQFYVGGTNVLVESLDPHQFWRLVEDEGITHITIVYTGLVAILDAYEEGKYELGSLRTFNVGGQTTPVAVIRRAVETWGPGIFFVVYGLTEASPLVTYLPKEDVVLEGEESRRLSSIGKELFTCHVRVVDEKDNDVRPGEMGEIIARGPNVMKGYWKRPEETDATLRDGWLRTGDMATVDEDGYIYIVDRKKDIIISGGENITPREIEEVLYRHPTVHQCAVIGVPDEKWGEQVKAVVVLKPGQEATERELIEYCTNHLAKYKCPKSVDFLDLLPTDPQGKIQKRLLREQYAD